MTKKINLLSLIAAIIIFALPWLDIRCAEKTMATQSGLQIIYGGGSISAEFKSLSDNTFNQDKKSNKKSNKESVGFAPLVAAAFIAIIAATAFAFIAISRDSKPANMLALVLRAIALLMLLIQMTIGFPIQKKLMQSTKKNSSKIKVDDSDFISAMISPQTVIHVKKTTAYYLELLALAFPTLLLANRLIDKCENKKTTDSPSSDSAT